MPRSRPIPDPRAIAEAYDAGAADFDARFAASPRSVARFQVIEAPLRRAAAGATRVLELGCGTGRLLAELPAARRVGIDLSAALLARAHARARRDLALARADAHALPFADACFDTIVAGNAVFRYLDYPRALRECARVLRPGGRLALHQYAARTLGHRRPPNPLHLDHPDELRLPGTAAGLIPEATYLYRGLRLWPYALRLPERLAVPGRLWDHAVLVFRKPAG